MEEKRGKPGEKRPSPLVPDDSLAHEIDGLPRQTQRSPKKDIFHASVNITGREAYSYSCMTVVPQPGYVGLAYETVLPGSSLYNTSDASANNIVWTLIPQNFTGDGEVKVRKGRK